jgi:hypothetical protein
MYMDSNAIQQYVNIIMVFSLAFLSCAINIWILWINHYNRLLFRIR